MKNPALLIANVTKEQSLETMDFLYFDRIDMISETPNNFVLWIKDGEVVAKWTEEYKNVMISKDFVESIDK